LPIEFLGIGVFGILLWYGGSLVLVEKELNAADARYSFSQIAFHSILQRECVKTRSGKTIEL
jgi:hypothetical protein